MQPGNRPPPATRSDQYLANFHQRQAAAQLLGATLREQMQKTDLCTHRIEREHQELDQTEWRT